MTNTSGGPLTRRLLAVAGALGLSMVFAAPALAASTYARPTITATRSTFTVPAGSTATWTLRLWSHGTLDGSDSGRSGVLSVAVPRTSDCEFQADVTSTPAGGIPFFYSGWRTTMANCGAPLQTITGHIYLCDVTGSPTTTEVPGGTLAANGPQTLASQANPVTSISVADGTYTMTADPPTGFLLVTCGGSASIGSSGLSASQSVSVPSGGAGTGVFYVSAPPIAGGGGGGGSPGGGGGAVGVTSVNGLTSSSGSKSVSSVGGPTAPAQAVSSRASATPVAGSALAFTGLNVGPPLLLGLMMLALGSLMIVISQRQRALARRRVASFVSRPGPSV